MKNAVQLLEAPVLPDPAVIAPDRALEYLQAVADKAQLDLISMECQPPAALPAFSIKPIAERAGAAPPARPEIYDERYEGYAHEGLNE